MFRFLRTNVQSRWRIRFSRKHAALISMRSMDTQARMEKPLTLFFSSLHLSFSWTYAPSPTFPTFTPEQASQSLSRRTFPASASLKLLPFAETFHVSWIFFCRYPFFLLTHQVFHRVRVLFHEPYAFIFLRLRFFLLLFIFLFFASSLIFG